MVFEQKLLFHKIFFYSSNFIFFLSYILIVGNSSINTLNLYDHLVTLQCF